MRRNRPRNAAYNHVTQVVPGASVISTEGTPRPTKPATNRPSVLFRGSLARSSRGCRSTNRPNSTHSERMVWGEAGALFVVACFWAVTLFMVVHGKRA